MNGYAIIIGMLLMKTLAALIASMGASLNALISTNSFMPLAMRMLQQNRQRLKLVAVEVKHRPEEIVPEPDPVEEADRHDDRLKEGG